MSYTSVVPRAAARVLRSAMIAALASALSALPAAAQTLSDPNVTPISGYRGGEITWLEANGSANGLKGLAWSEASDAPCTMTVVSKRLANANATSEGGTLNLCRDGINWWPQGFATILDVVNRGQTKGVELSGDRAFIRGIAACSNNSNNHRLKGVRIYAATVDAGTYAVAPTNNRVEERHSNCSTWQSPVYCPDDKIAVAVVVHHTNNEITGLALRCMQVRR